MREQDARVWLALLVVFEKGGADKGRYGDIVSKGIGEHPAADCGMIAV
jgi:hypothetical protein